MSYYKKGPHGVCTNCLLGPENHSAADVCMDRSTLVGVYGRENPMMKWLAERHPRALHESAHTACSEYGDDDA